VTIGGLPLGSAFVKILDDGRPIAGAAVELESEEELVLRIAVGEGSRRFRVVDAGGTPLPSTFVRFAIDGDETAGLGGTTDAAGLLECGGLPETGVTAHLRHAVAGTASHVPVAAPVDPTEVVDLRLEADSRWAAALRDSEGPVAGVSCRLRLEGSTVQVGRESLSNESGSIAWEGVAQGNYDFVARHPGYWPVALTLPDSGGVAHTIEMHRLGNLDVRVHSASGTPVPGVPVSIESDEFGAAVSDWSAQDRVHATPPDLVTDATGRVVVQGLPQGAYRWRVARPSAQDLGGEVTVSADGTADLVVVLPQ
jgi:hypothetical protein